MIYHGHWVIGLAELCLSIKSVDLSLSRSGWCLRFKKIQHHWFNSAKQTVPLLFSRFPTSLGSASMPHSRIGGFTVWRPWQHRSCKNGCLGTSINFKGGPPLWNPWKSFGKPQDNHGKTIGTWWIYQEEWWLSGNLCWFIIAKLVGV